jgi:hypothetical protein
LGISDLISSDLRENFFDLLLTIVRKFEQSPDVHKSFTNLYFRKVDGTFGIFYVLIESSLFQNCHQLSKVAFPTMPGFSFREAGPRSKSQFLRRQVTELTETENDFHGDSHHKPPQGWGRGIVSDFKSTIAKHWVKEMTNFNTKTIAVSFFLFIAVIAPSITFGAVYAKRTNNYIGTVELLVSTAWCGIFYSLFSGMPMVRKW